MTQIPETSDATFARDVLASARPVVVDFTAPWCAPCRTVAPIMEQLAGEHAARVSFVTLDVDSSPETAARYGVLSLPTAVLFEDGEARVTVAGARPRRHYEQAWGPWLACGRSTIV